MLFKKLTLLLLLFATMSTWATGPDCDERDFDTETKDKWIAQVSRLERIHFDLPSDSNS